MATLPIVASSQIARRATRSAVALLIRQGLVYGANIGGGVILARLLTPAEFGCYGVVIFALMFLNVFGGTGFAANLIRLPEDPELDEMQAVFTAQQSIVVLLCLSLWFVAPHLATAYKMGGGGPLFFRLIALSLFLTSMMVMPQIKLERELAFDKLALIEVIQAIVFNGSAVIFAWRHEGILSFSLALVLRSAAGAVLATLIAPWKMRIRLEPSLIRRHIHFGLALQGANVLSSIKDSIAPVFVGMYLGISYVGYVTWANTLATYAVVALMPLQRLYLPFFSRLQHDRSELRRYAAHTIWFTNAIAAPVTMVTVAFANPITTIIFGNRWLVALPLFYYLVFGNIFVACSTPMLGVLNALERAHTSLLMTAMWMISTWAFGVPLTLAWGLHGYGLAMVCVSMTNIVLYWIVWRELGLIPWPAYWPSWPVACILALLMRFSSLARTRSTLPQLAVGVAIYLLFYFAALYAISPERFISLRRMLRTRPAEDEVLIESVAL